MHYVAHLQRSAINHNNFQNPVTAASLLITSSTSSSPPPELKIGAFVDGTENWEGQRMQKSNPKNSQRGVSRCFMRSERANLAFSANGTKTKTQSLISWSLNHILYEEQNNTTDHSTLTLKNEIHLTALHVLIEGG